MEQKSMILDNLKKTSQKVQDVLTRFGLELVVKEFPNTTHTLNKLQILLGVSWGK